MSERVVYDPELFTVERASVASASLGHLVLGVSKLGVTASVWVTVPAATFNYSAGYSPNEESTLIIDAETASVSLSFWDTVGDVLYPGDRVRVTYDTAELFVGTVDGVSLTFVADPAAVHHGATRRVDFSASLVGAYAASMGKIVTYHSLPGELAIARIRRWVEVSGWPD